MKLVLTISKPGGDKAFNYAGSSIRIGKNPASELAFDGDEFPKISWDHAAIELKADGAVLTDLGSSNKTLLNGKEIAPGIALPIRVTDTIRLGYTGPELVVEKIDLTVPRVVEPPKPPDARVLWLVGGGVGLLAVLVGWFVFGRNAPPDVIVSVPPPAVEPTKPDPMPKPAIPPVPPLIERVELPPPPMPEFVVPKVKQIGRFVGSPEKAGVPGLLLRRQTEAFAWQAVPPPADVSTETQLVSLPGYRSVIDIDTPPSRVMLWGSLPTLWPDPVPAAPVADCSIILHEPSAGVGVDLTLLYGRVMLLNRESSKPLTAKVQFASESWEVILADPKSELSIELRTVPGTTKADGSPGSPPGQIVIAFNKGPAVVKTGRDRIDLNGPAVLAWTNFTPDKVERQELKELPTWWSAKPKVEEADVQSTILALKDWTTILAGSADLVDRMQTQVRESADPDVRLHGVLFMAAMDVPSPLVDFLEERDRGEVREAAVTGLRQWLGRDPEHRSELMRRFEQKQYAATKRNLLMRLLGSFTADEMRSPALYQELVGHLEHESIAVRQLAVRQLALLAPAAAGELVFPVAGTAEDRAAAVAKWKAAFPAGKLP